MMELGEKSGDHKNYCNAYCGDHECPSPNFMEIHLVRHFETFYSAPKWWTDILKATLLTTNIELLSSSCVFACACHQSVGPISVGVLKADWGWSLCVLHPLSLHPSALHPLHSANPGEKQKTESEKGNKEKIMIVKIKAQSKTKKSTSTHRCIFADSHTSRP